jgi:hypothetical protein
MTTRLHVRWARKVFQRGHPSPFESSIVSIETNQTNQTKNEQHVHSKSKVQSPKVQKSKSPRVQKSMFSHSVSSSQTPCASMTCAARARVSSRTSAMGRDSCEGVTVCIRSTGKTQFSSGHSWWRACQNLASGVIDAPLSPPPLNANVKFSPATAQVEFRHQSAESAAFRPWRPFPSRPSTTKSAPGGHRALAASGRNARQEAAEARARGGRKCLSASSSTPRRHKRRGDTGLPQDGSLTIFIDLQL